VGGGSVSDLRWHDQISTYSGLASTDANPLIGPNHFRQNLCEAVITRILSKMG